jgi:hypothetical protein
MAATKTKSTRPPPSSAAGRQASSGSAKKSAAVSKTKQKPNGNIMNFFKKEETGLFIAENGGPVASLGAVAVRVEEHEQRLHDQPDRVHIAALVDAIRVGISVLAVGGFAQTVASESGNELSQRTACD